MKTLLFVILMGISSATFAEGYKNNYECVTIQGVKPRTSISIVEEYNSAYKLTLASATVKNEESGVSTTLDVEVSSKPHPQHPEFQVLNWVGKQFKVEGYLSLLDGRRNFMAYYVSSEKDSPLTLSCYF